MCFQLFPEIQIIGYFLRITATYLALILSFFLVVTFTIPHMIQWRDYCMHHICCFGTDTWFGFSYIFVLQNFLRHSMAFRPGSIQARGDNLFSLIKGFANSSMLQNFNKQASPEITIHQDKDDGAIFFDYLSWFMVCFEYCYT